MKSDMQPGEYTAYAKKRFRCEADSHSQMKRCLLCGLRPYELCDVVRCQPDESDDHQAVIFRLTCKFRKEAAR